MLLVIVNLDPCSEEGFPYFERIKEALSDVLVQNRPTVSLKLMNIIKMQKGEFSMIRE
jgi:hypothetical protein